MTETTLSGDGPRDAPDDGSASARPTDAELPQHLGAAVLLCWNELSFQAQVGILAHPPSPEGGLRRTRANDVIGTKPIPGARNAIVKLLLRHTKT
jgi:hypothetical protein